MAIIDARLRSTARVQLQGAVPSGRRDLECAIPDAGTQANDSSVRPCRLQRVVRPQRLGLSPTLQDSGADEAHDAENQLQPELAAECSVGFETRWRRVAPERTAAYEVGANAQDADGEEGVGDTVGDHRRSAAV